MARQLRYQLHWIFCIAALAVWLTLGGPVAQAFSDGSLIRGVPVSPLWFVPFTIFGAAVLGAMALKLPASRRWTLLGVQVAAVVAMAIILPWAMMSAFLIIVSWQVGLATTPAKALGWVAFQMLAVVGALGLAPVPDFCWVLGKTFALQLLVVFTAHALRKEAETARALTRSNKELRSAQVMIANTVRDAERLRISRQLHDAWGHELTALGLQLEIASNVTEPSRVSNHVLRAKGLARDLLAKVRDVVATLREAERRDLKDALDTRPDRAEISPGLQVNPDQANALIRRAQEAVTDDSRHAKAFNPWLQPSSYGEGGRLLARDNSNAGPVPHSGGTPPTGLRNQHHWILCIAALAVWFALGWPFLQDSMTGMTRPGPPVPDLWFIPFAIFGAAILGAIVLKLRTSLRWTLLSVQVAAVLVMAAIAPRAPISVLLIVIAWQVAMATTPGKALGWVAVQTLAVMVTLGGGFSYVVGLSFALQLLVVFTAHALRNEEEAARALTQANQELRSARGMIADMVRNAERLRISRELHDAWGHELTALGLQLEIASNVTEPARVNDHVVKARGLARDLLAKVRDVVATLREAEPCDLKDALEALARSVPTPVIHVSISPGAQVSPDQAHALMRCAQEAVTNAVRHAKASNLWLQVTADGDGVRLVARDDGNAKPKVSAPGSGLLGMRERVESLGGRLAVQAGAGLGFTIEAWLPPGSPRAA